MDSALTIPASDLNPLTVEPLFYQQANRAYSNPEANPGLPGTFFNDSMAYMEEGFLGPGEVQAYNEALTEIKAEDASPVAYPDGTYVEKPATRSCIIRWPNRSHGGLVADLYSRVEARVQEVNEAFYHYEIERGPFVRNRGGKGGRKGFMVADYERPGDWFRAHRDAGVVPEMKHRKITGSLQMTDGERYTGADLWVADGFGRIQAPRSIGTLILFPSFQFHQVDKLVSGQRRSVVFWVEGEKPLR